MNPPFLFKVAYPHCATCFGRCYPGGAALIMDAKSLYDGLGRLLTHSPSRELPKPVNDADGKTITENGDLPVVENGVNPAAEETEGTNEDEKEQPLQTEQKREE